MKDSVIFYSRLFASIRGSNPETKEPAAKNQDICSPTTVSKPTITTMAEWFQTGKKIFRQPLCHPLRLSIKPKMGNGSVESRKNTFGKELIRSYGCRI